MATVLREAKNGRMALDKDVRIALSDGTVLRADVYRPVKDGKYPVLMTYGPYGKDSHISQFMGKGWDSLKARYPEIVADSTSEHMVFERPDPEVWVPHDYILIQVDCRGAGRSPGKLDVNSPQEFVDFKEAIEWAGQQPWSNGKIGPRASPTTLPANGWSRPIVRNTWPRSCLGPALATSTATARGMAACSAMASSRAGGRTAC